MFYVRQAENFIIIFKFFSCLIVLAMSSFFSGSLCSTPKSLLPQVHVFLWPEAKLVCCAGLSSSLFIAFVPSSCSQGLLSKTHPTSQKSSCAFHCLQNTFLCSFMLSQGSLNSIFTSAFQLPASHCTKILGLSKAVYSFCLWLLESTFAEKPNLGAQVKDSELSVCFPFPWPHTHSFRHSFVKL